MAVWPNCVINIWDLVDPTGRLNRCPVCGGEITWYPTGAVAANSEVCDRCKEIERTTEWGCEG